MKYYPAKPDSAANSPGLGSVTHPMTPDRARQLAVMSGRTSFQLTMADHKQTKRELTGATDHHRKNPV